ncbi:hypothetical protein HY489_04110 [Candidatus Woesearchaeota archaeon]|nr:hypothetical protein [Candidatus Woesearchaeota archaeon]
MIDVVFPDGNESEFLAMAKRLGIDGLLFVYRKRTSAAGRVGLLVDASGVSRARDAGFLTVCLASREAVERGADLVFGFELVEGRDPTHFRRSELNQVVCRLASDKGVQIGFSFASVLASSGMQRAVLLGRLMQNVRLCEKYGVRVRLASFASSPWQMRAPAEMVSLFSELGVRNARKYLG